jgi:hypothetical protein
MPKNLHLKYWILAEVITSLSRDWGEQNYSFSVRLLKRNETIMNFKRRQCTQTPIKRRWRFTVQSISSKEIPV